jgi:hypothetical protein
MNDDRKFKRAASRNKKSGEIYKVSQKLNFDGINYRQIAYYKSFLGINGKEMSGICYITNDGNTVGDKYTIENLAKLGYRAETFFDENSVKTYEGFIESDEKINEKKEQYDALIPALKLFKDEDVAGCDEIMDILNKHIDYKIANREIIEKYIDKIRSCEGMEEIVFTKEMTDEVKTYYNEVFMQNFRTVKLFDKGRDYYGGIRKKINHEKRSIATTMTAPGIKRMSLRLETFVDYACNLLKLYDKVIDLNENEYIKYFNNIEKEKIEERISLVRKNK